jgi:PST family polysaccharide transporter
VALAPALIIGAHIDGIRGAAMAHVLVAVVVALPLFLDTLRRASIDLPAIGRQLLRPALGVVAMVALGAAVHPLLPTSFVHLLVFGPLLLVAYVVVALPAHELARRARPLLRRGTS